CVGGGTEGGAGCAGTDCGGTAGGAGSRGACTRGVLAQAANNNAASGTRGTKWRGDMDLIECVSETIGKSTEIATESKGREYRPVMHGHAPGTCK
ncbi:MAG TPA: hypothetical protein PKC15_13775, partial [Rhodocyclaceae bacterium]|nr:hypothetical protein [Rhodocyclaceae bacterium]